MRIVERGIRAVRRCMRRAGFDVHAFPPRTSREAFLRKLGVSVVVDVGANIGQYASRLRDNGYRGRILSFEPLAEPFRVLERWSSRDAHWTCFNLALGRQDGGAVMNQAEFSVFSSFLPTTSFIEELDPRSAAQTRERVVVRRLDGLLDEIELTGPNAWLKVDTQGFEIDVIEGASGCLDRFGGVELEMSMHPVYEGQAAFETVRSFMADRGFVLAGLSPGFCDPHTNELVEVDGIFLRAPPPKGCEVPG